MISVQNADSALRSTCIGVFSNLVNNSTNPILNMTAKNTKNISGKRIVQPISSNINKAIAMAEDDAITVAQHANFSVIDLPLKNIYGTMNITDKALRTSIANTTEFANLLSDEMEYLIKSSQSKLNGMLYLNGMEIFDIIDFTCSHTQPPPNVGFVTKNYAFYEIGKTYYAYDNNFNYLQSFTVNSINASQSKIMTSNAVLGNADRGASFYIAKALDHKKGLNINGIESIFNNTTLYNLDLADTKNSGLKPFVYKEPDFTAASVEPRGKAWHFTEKQMFDALEMYEEKCGKNCDYIVSNGEFKNRLADDIKATRQNVDTMELAGGFKAMSISGIPFYTDEKCCPNNLYFINTPSWAMYQMGDWQWMAGDDAKILKRVHGKPYYTATIAKYCDFLCSKPFLNGKIHNYVLTRYTV